MLFRSRKRRQAETAVLDRREESLEADRLAAEGKLFEAIDLLTEANRTERDPRLEREIRGYRHLAGIELLKDPPSEPAFPEPAASIPPRESSRTSRRSLRKS